MIIFQEQLLLEAAVSLVGNPRLENPDDPTRQQLIRVAETVAEKDPEFILKVKITFSVISLTSDHFFIFKPNVRSFFFIFKLINKEIFLRIHIKIRMRSRKE